MVQGYVAHFQQPGSLGQLTHHVNVVGYAVYLGIIAVSKSARATHPA